MAAAGTYHRVDRRLAVATILACIALCSFVLSSTPAHAKQLFVTTIHDTDLYTVQEVAVHCMKERGFAPDRVEERLMTFRKRFDDAFWLGSRNMVVKFDTKQDGPDVVLMVTQYEDNPHAHARGRMAIDHLAPIIRDIRHSVDGTPLNRIYNEAATGAPRKESRNRRGTRSDTVEFSPLDDFPAYLDSALPPETNTAVALKDDAALESIKTPQVGYAGHLGYDAKDRKLVGDYGEGAVVTRYAKTPPLPEDDVYEMYDMAETYEPREVEFLSTTGLQFEGTVVVWAVPLRAAHRYGIQEGDAVLEVNGKPVRHRGPSLTRFLDNCLDLDRSVALTFERGGRKYRVVIKD
jgi:Trypsin-like serine proteases, typically periplasmic, contain C-terminal PDZ domain